MNNLSPATSNYLLEVSLEDLHQESRSWLSEIELWRFELAFYQRLLDKVSGKITEVEDKKASDHFQHLNRSFAGELLDQYEHDIREHEKYLDRMIREKMPFNEQLYREVHKKYQGQVLAFDRDFKQYRKDLYGFAEKFI